MKELIVKARENGTEMLKLVNAFEPLIKKCIRIYVKNLDFYEDGMQQGRMAVIQCIKKYDINSNYPFQAYVKRGVYYTLRDFGKKLWNNDLSFDFETSEDGSKLSDMIDSGERTDEDFVKSEEISKLHKAIEKLSDKHRKIIVEVYFNNKPMTELCEGRRCHYMTIVGMKERALKKLREFME